MVREVTSVTTQMILTVVYEATEMGFECTTN